MELRPSLTVWGKRVEIFLAGYRLEHFILALQIALVLILSLVPVFVNRAYRALDNAASFWIPLAAVAVLEPCTGNALRKFLIRIVAVALALGMGTLVLLVAYDVCDTSPLDLPHNQTLFAHMVCLGTVICAALIMLHRQRWATEYEYAFFLLQISLLIIVVPSVREVRADALENAAWRALNVVVGVTISAVISSTVFPIKARAMLQRQTAAVLLQTGDLAAWVMSEVADARPTMQWAASPEEDGTVDTHHNSNNNLDAVRCPLAEGLPGATCSDRQMRYLDDGLFERLLPLYEQSRSLAVHLARLDDLLRSARAEFNIFTRPHWFPGDTYAVLLTSMHVAISLLQSQLYLMSTGAFSTAATRLVAPDIREAGLQLSVVFTILSRMSHTPRPFRKRFLRAFRRWRQGVVRTLHLPTMCCCTKEEKTHVNGQTQIDRVPAAPAMNQPATTATISSVGRGSTNIMALTAMTSSGKYMAAAAAAAVVGGGPSQDRTAGLGWVDASEMSEVMQGRGPNNLRHARISGKSNSSSGRQSPEEQEPTAVFTSHHPGDEEAAMPSDQKQQSLTKEEDLTDDPFACMVVREEDDAGDRIERPSLIHLGSTEFEQLQKTLRQASRNAAAAGKSDAEFKHSTSKELPPSEEESQALTGPAAKLLELHRLCQRLMSAGDGSISRGAPGSASLVQTAGCLMGLSRQAACILGALDPGMAAPLHDQASWLNR